MLSHRQTSNSPTLNRRPGRSSICGTLLAASCLLVLVGCQLGSDRPTFRGPGDTLEAQDPRSVAYVGLTRISGGAVGQDLFPAPLPNGDGVVFSSDRHSENLKLYLWSEEKPGAIRLTSGAGDDIHATSDPGSDSIVFASDRDGQWRLYRLTGLDGAGSIQALTEPETAALHPSFDPTGNRIVYMRRSPEGRWEVWIMDLVTKSERFICDGLFPEFHPTRERLIVQRARQRDARWYSLHLIDLGTGLERELVAGADWGAVNPSFHPNGSWIVFNSVRERSSDDSQPKHGDDLWCMTEEGQRLTRLTETPRAEWNPVWGRDGHVYFTSIDRDRPGVWRLMPNLPKLPAPMHPLELPGQGARSLQTRMH